MCGRYVSPEEAQLNREYHVDARNSHIRTLQTLESLAPPSYNVAPTHAVPVVRVIRGSQGEREALLMRWGLIPFFSRGEAPAYSTFMATIEKIDTGAAWRGPWRRGQRCIIPCVGFYEWQLRTGGRKQPYFVRPAHEETFAMAGLWDKSITNDGEVILSCTVITMPANELMQEIHNTKQRMPALLQREHVDLWLNGDIDEARGVLLPYPSADMIAWPVSERVNAPRNNDAQLIEPVQDDSQAPLF